MRDREITNEQIECMLATTYRGEHLGTKKEGLDPIGALCKCRGATFELGTGVKLYAEKDVIYPDNKSIGVLCLARYDVLDLLDTIHIDTYHDMLRSGEVHKLLREKLDGCKETAGCSGSTDYETGDGEGYWE